MRQDQLLRELGRRLRGARERSGLGLVALAERSGLSRRYVSEAEAGRANPSIWVLARLSDATGVPLTQLLDFELPRSNSERIALVGLRGAGKSSVGRALALELDAPFIELDQEIEREAGLPLGQIFELHGQEAFHRYESEALERVLGSGDRFVLATGGSIVESPETYERLLATCRTVWLEASPEDHLARVIDQGDRRPMRGRPRAFAELEAILERRRPQYERCSLSLPTTTKSASEVTSELLALLSGEGG